jgi:hypothetical protein
LYEALIYQKIKLTANRLINIDVNITGFIESYYDFKESFKYHIIYMYNVFR